MANKRVSKTVIANVTKERYEESLASYAKADVREQKLNALMDEQMTKIRFQSLICLYHCASILLRAPWL